MENLKSYKKYINEHDIYVCEILGIIEFMGLDLEKFDLNEAVQLNEVSTILKQVDKINPYLSKIGIKARYKKNLYHHLLDAGIGVAKMFMYLWKGEPEKVKEMMKQVSKEDVAAFILSLDKATLNLIGGTLGRLEAITGWKLVANAKQVAQKSVEVIKNAFKTIRKYLFKVSPDPDKHKKVVKKVEQMVLKESRVDNYKLLVGYVRKYLTHKKERYFDDIFYYLKNELYHIYDVTKNDVKRVLDYLVKKKEVGVHKGIYFLKKEFGKLKFLKDFEKDLDRMWFKI